MSLFGLAKSNQKPWKLPRQFSPTAMAEGETADIKHPNALCQPFVLAAAIAGKFPGAKPFGVSLDGGRFSFDAGNGNAGRRPWVPIVARTLRLAGGRLG